MLSNHVVLDTGMRGEALIATASANSGKFRTPFYEYLQKMQTITYIG